MNRTLASAAAAAALLCLAAGPALAATVTVTSGSGQAVRKEGVEVPGGMAWFAPFSVVVKNAGGGPIPGVPVTFDQVPGTRIACMFSRMGAVTLVVRTDADGRASVNGYGGKSMRCYGPSSKFQIEASAEGAKALVNLELLDALPPPPALADARIEAVHGGGQTARQDIHQHGRTGRFGVLQAKVTSGGKPLTGVQVQWACQTPAGECDVSMAGSRTTASITDSYGQATLNQMYGGKSVFVENYIGPLTVTAAYGKAVATFHLTVVK